MEFTKYLIITKGPKSWSSPNVQLISSLSPKKSIPSNAVVMKLQLQIPDALFTKPQLEATIKVPTDQVSRPLITANVMDNIKQVIREQLNVEMEISVVEKKEEE